MVNNLKKTHTSMNKIRKDFSIFTVFMLILFSALMINDFNDKSKVDFRTQNEALINNTRNQLETACLENVEVGDYLTYVSNHSNEYSVKQMEIIDKFSNFESVNLSIESENTLFTNLAGKTTEMIEIDISNEFWINWNSNQYYRMIFPETGLLQLSSELETFLETNLYPDPKYDVNISISDSSISVNGTVDSQVYFQYMEFDLDTGFMTIFANQTGEDLLVLTLVESSIEIDLLEDVSIFNINIGEQMKYTNNLTRLELDYTLYTIQYLGYFCNGPSRYHFAVGLEQCYKNGIQILEVFSFVGFWEENKTVIPDITKLQPCGSDAEVYRYLQAHDYPPSGDELKVDYTFIGGVYIQTSNITYRNPADDEYLILIDFDRFMYDDNLTAYGVDVGDELYYVTFNTHIYEDINPTQEYFKFKIRAIFYTTYECAVMGDMYRGYSLNNLILNRTSMILAHHGGQYGNSHPLHTWSGDEPDFFEIENGLSLPEEGEIPPIIKSTRTPLNSSINTSTGITELNNTYRIIEDQFCSYSNYTIEDNKFEHIVLNNPQLNNLGNSKIQNLPFLSYLKINYKNGLLDKLSYRYYNHIIQKIIEYRFIFIGINSPENSGVQDFEWGVFNGDSLYWQVNETHVQSSSEPVSFSDIHFQRLDVENVIFGIYDDSNALGTYYYQVPSYDLMHQHDSSEWLNKTGLWTGICEDFENIPPAMNTFGIDEVFCYLQPCVRPTNLFEIVSHASVNIRVLYEMIYGETLTCNEALGISKDNVVLLCQFNSTVNISVKLHYNSYGILQDSIISLISEDYTYTIHRVLVSGNGECGEYWSLLNTSTDNEGEPEDGIEPWIYITSISGGCLIVIGIILYINNKKNKIRPESDSVIEKIENNGLDLGT